MNEKVAVVSLGCAKNLICSEQMLNLLDEAGYRIVDRPEDADVAVVNTCGFIESAKMEAIDNILSLGELKKEGKLKKLLVAGCLSQRYREELAKEMPEIDGMLGVGSYADIAEAVKKVLAGESVSRFGDINAPVDEIGRIVSTGPGWAYLRIAEGCDNRCAYCAIPDIRGRYRSRPFESVVSEAEALAASGVRELIVIAQDITRYGTDLYGRRRLHELLRAFSEIDGIEWIRLHYLYPDEIDDELIGEIRDNPKVLKYLDIPIQHINDRVLKRMNRRGTGEEIRVLFRRLRAEIPGLVLRTSLIAGLPGEGEAEFEELCDFLREAKIERAGVFPFSPEEGTPAAKMEYADTETANRRAELLTDIQDQIMDDFDRSRHGKAVRLLCEGFDAETLLYWGRSFAESPDIDGRILFAGAEAVPGEFYDVVISGESGGELVGTVLPDTVKGTKEYEPAE